MTRTATVILMVALLLVGSLAGAVGGVAAHEGHDHDETASDTPSGDDNASTLPVGQRLGVVIDAQSTEVKTEFDDARFRAQMRAATDKPALAHQRADELQREVADLRAERAALIDEFRAGNITKDAFLARLTMLNNRVDAKTDLAARAEVEVRMNGLDGDKLARLQQNARDLSGAEVSALARSLTDNGRADVAVEADDHGNVQFRPVDSSTSGLDEQPNDRDERMQDRFAVKHEQHHALWEDRHTKFHDNVNATGQFDADAHDAFHAMMDRHHERFHARWERILNNGPPEDRPKKPTKPTDRDSDTAVPDRLDGDALRDLGVGIDGTTVTVYARGATDVVAGATVFADGQTVGHTNEYGRLVFEATEDMRADGELELRIESDGDELTHEAEFDAEQDRHVGIGDKDVDGDGAGEDE